MSFATKCFQTSLVIVLLLMSETKFQNDRQIYSFGYSDFYVFRQQTRRQKALDWTAASITPIQSVVVVV
jgi:hypothetical protein